MQTILKDPNKYR